MLDHLVCLPILLGWHLKGLALNYLKATFSSKKLLRVLSKCQENDMSRENTDTKRKHGFRVSYFTTLLWKTGAV